MNNNGITPVIVTTAELRLAFRRFMEPSYPQLLVLAYQELPSETQIEPFGAIALANQSLPDEIVDAMNEQESAHKEPVAA
jgi:hypothetical protein